LKLKNSNILKDVNWAGRLNNNELDLIYQIRY